VELYKQGVNSFLYEYKLNNIMDVSIIIVNYNTKALTNECINSIIEQTKQITFEIILVDNNSIDGSIDFFSNDSRIKFIQAGSNLGFGKANNLGLKYAIGKYIFFLNSDTYLTSNSIKKLFDFAEKHIELNIGELGVLLLDKNGNYNVPFSVLPSLNIFRNVMRHLKLTNDNSDIVINNIKRIGYAEVGFVCGADVFVPRIVLDKIGGAFDSNFFMFCEEIDMAKRMEISGYKRIIINDTGIIHYGASSFDMSKMTFRRYQMMTESVILYHKKYDSWFTYKLFIIYRLILAYRDMLKLSFSYKEMKLIFNMILKG